MKNGVYSQLGSYNLYKGGWNSEKPTGTYITTSEAVDMNQAKGIYPGKTITQKTRQSKITVITLQP